MKGFKSTGNGPKYGSFAFPSKAGFGPSSGRVKSISGYTRRAGKRPKRLAVGGLAEDGIVEAPGFSDFAEGGKVKGVSDPMSAKEAMGHKLGGKAKRRMGYAKGGVAVDAMKNAMRKKLGAQFTEAEYQQMMKKSGKAPTNRVRPVKAGPRNTVRFAEGGKVSAAKAKQIAQGVVKDHVNYPAPKGHKGFNRNAVIGK